MYVLNWGKLVSVPVFSAGDCLILPLGQSGRDEHLTGLVALVFYVFDSALNPVYFLRFSSLSLAVASLGLEGQRLQSACSKPTLCCSRNLSVALVLYTVPHCSYL